jgi:DnaD/phage-associated family protein
MGFGGFAENERRQVSIPEQFFRELLGEIDDLDELRLMLNIFWRLQRQEGPFRAVRWRELLDDDSLSRALGGKRNTVEAALEKALRKAEQRSSLLTVMLSTDGGEERLVLLNSPRGRAALAAIRRGDLRLSSNPAQPLKFAGERPNVYQLYEASIGPLTPMIAEALKDAETSFDPAWVAEAIQIAVERNKRHWRYVDAILRRWEQGGRNDQKDRQDRRDTEEARHRYAKRDN